MPSCCDEATQRERQAWEEIITRVAKRVGIETEDKSAGEIITAMGQHIRNLHTQIARLLDDGRPI